MKVLVITSVAENEEDLQIVMVARVDDVTMASPVVTLKGEVASRRGNPYLVYGDAVADFLGRVNCDTSITVADCRSGSLEGWL